MRLGACHAATDGRGQPSPSALPPRSRACSRLLPSRRIRAPGLAPRALNQAGSSPRAGTAMSRLPSAAGLPPVITFAYIRPPFRPCARHRRGRSVTFSVARRRASLNVAAAAMRLFGSAISALKESTGLDLNEFAQQLKADTQEVSAKNAAPRHAPDFCARAVGPFAGARLGGLRSSARSHLPFVCACATPYMWRARAPIARVDPSARLVAWPPAPPVPALRPQP